MIDTHTKTLDNILNIIGKEEIVSAYLKKEINQDLENNYADIEIFTKNNPYNMSYKKYRDIEEFINGIDCYISIELTEEAYAEHNMDIDYLMSDYYEGVSPDHCYSIYNDYHEYRDKKDFYTMNIQIDYKNNKYIKEITDVGVSKLSDIDNNKINRTLDKFKEDGYNVDNEFYRKEKVYNVEDILLYIKNLINNKEIKDELNLLKSEDTILNNEEISLNLSNRDIYLSFLFEGYNFHWNSPRLDKFEKYNLPIDYTLIEKGWTKEISVAERKVEKFNDIYNPLILVNHFKGSIDLEKQSIYSSNNMKIILNKGEVKDIFITNKKIYLMNEKKDVIFNADKKYVLDKDKLIEDINYIIKKCW